MKDNKTTLRNSLIIGSAIFSMFFGAGNMIFPPYLGFVSGNEWFAGFLGYYIADIGLALIALISLAKFGGFKKVFSPIGSFFGTVIMFAIVLCIGPIITLPRTAATTFELSVLPLAKNFNMVIFYIIFFLAVLFLCIKKSAVVDIVGKILTPLLLAGLLGLIIIGIINPLGEWNNPPHISSVIGEGIEAGYQSMDVLATVIFGVLIFDSITNKGYNKPNEKTKVAVLSGGFAGIALMIVYLGMTFLGATASGQYNMHIGRTEFLVNIIKRLVPGNFGLIFFGIIVGLACLSTAIALTSSAAEYIANFSKNKISYKVMVIIICIFGTVVSCLGVEGLIKLGSPILNLVYPPVLTLILMSFLQDKVSIWSHRLAVIASFSVSLISILFTFSNAFRFINYLPLRSFGLEWVLPTIIFAIIGAFIKEKKVTE